MLGCAVGAHLGHGLPDTSGQQRIVADCWNSGLTWRNATDQPCSTTALDFTRQRPLGRHNTSAVRCLALGDQVLHDLGLALQPGQPRLLVHAGHLLARGQALTHDGDELAVGSCLLLQGPGW